MAADVTRKDALSHQRRHPWTAASIVAHGSCLKETVVRKVSPAALRTIARKKVRASRRCREPASKVQVRLSANASPANKATWLLPAKASSRLRRRLGARPRWPA